MYHTNPTNYEYLRIYESQNGVSLLFIVLITSLILAISLGICAILIQEMRLMTEIGYSVSAFYAADSGIEAALYNLYQSDSPASVRSDESDDAELGEGSYDTLTYCCNFELGIEKCSFGNPDNPEDKRPDCPLGADYIGSTDPNDFNYCDAKNYCLKSLGSYKKVKRAIEINY